MISESFLWWSLAAVLLFWSVGAYNRLVRLRSLALRSFSALATPMQRYAEIVQFGSAIPVSPADTAFIAPTQAWAGLQGAQAQFSASLAVARSRPLDGAAINALAAADTVLQMAWLRVATEGATGTGPVLPDTAQAQWNEARQQIRPAAQSFAQAVHSYNAAINQFPAMLLAWLFGFRTATSLPTDP
ncbi:LemA family protein [Rhodoferax sp. WC2427]|uniref:LemA family protein n=1 Tax=Rhodoferax sp. WC2427 TaxID=3234144 RepID=UPI003464F5C4